MGAQESAIFLAADLVFSGDYQLYSIVALSLKVSLLATGIATCLGLPLAALLAIARFPGWDIVATFLNAMLGLPPVVVGLFVYLSLSRAGPLGMLGLLFTPTAMVIAQTILITPIVAAIALRSLEDFNSEYAEQLRAMGLTGWERAQTLLWEARFSLATAVLAGFGRAVAEVGAVMIVGGNIANVTRVMTTAIALETSKGDLALALALGVILILLALVVNLIASAAREIGRKAAGEAPARGEA
ncbi:MAG: ABC transporter permease [Alphaproteobacteria bacterium]|nr:ABC transporter permease [Alphaproteobacteria bacterium]